jgi:DNA-damage-inducible protein D
MSALEVFHFQDGRPSFEDFGESNGFRSWSARKLMECLEYENYPAFKKAVNKAMAACGTLNIPIDENFVKSSITIDGKEVEDYRLSRFACYLTAMNGDVKKPQVAMAQAYFAAIADSFRQYLEHADNIERLAIRDEVTDREKSLSGVAKSCGVTMYPYFQNAGYRGMYNMNLTDLKNYKRIPDAKRSLLDFMGKDELAANLFRITQTELKLRNEGIKTQGKCENAAYLVGKDVRETMQRISGTTPEDLPLAGDIKHVSKNLKGAHKGFKKLDFDKGSSED